MSAIRKLNPSEQQIQEAFVAWVEANAFRHPALRRAYRITNDPDKQAVRGMDIRRKAIRVTKAKKMGMRPGMPDYCIPFFGAALYIEFKSTGGRISEDQAREARELVALGHDVHFAFSVESAIAKVEERLKCLK